MGFERARRGGTVCVVYRADDARLVTRAVPGSLPGLCSRCERAVVVTPGTRRSWPDAELVCTECLTPAERVQQLARARSRPPTRLQVREIFAFYFSR